MATLLAAGAVLVAIAEVTGTAPETMQEQAEEILVGSAWHWET